MPHHKKIERSNPIQGWMTLTSLFWLECSTGGASLGNIGRFTGRAAATLVVNLPCTADFHLPSCILQNLIDPYLSPLQSDILPLSVS